MGSRLLYNLVIRLYSAVVFVASLWNDKAREWTRGRKDLFEKLQKKLDPAARIIWIHCSSAGEFEQAKPIVEELKREYPGHKILVSFFSPSGFAAASNYPHADYLTYLPVDTKEHAHKFANLIKPELVVFIKYEFWFHHLSAIAFRHIPLILVSAVFRKNQVFFRSYAKFYRQMLFLFRHIFVQDHASKELLQAYGIHHCSVSGDTRFDRVIRIMENGADISLINEFTAGGQTIVAGSTWDEDEALLSAWDGTKLIIAPHETAERRISAIEKRFSDAVRFSRLAEGETGRVLIIDNVGMLSTLYRYATVAYVGGGFTGDGIHNILEAAVYGKPVLFGPNYRKYREAVELIARGGAFSVKNAGEMKIILESLFNDRQALEQASGCAEKYVQENRGATAAVIAHIQANRLLTR